MIPTKAIRNATMELLAADTATLAPAANANQMILFTNNITPDENTVIGDLTEATFPGYAALSVGLNAQHEAFDPATGDSMIDLLPPAGGFYWESTGVPVAPETIYGYALTNNGKTTLLASQLFDVPPIISDTNQRVEDLDASLRLPANSIN